MSQIQTKFIEDSAVSTAKILDAAVTEAKLNTSVAGAGLTGGGGSALAVGAGSGISVAADSVAVDSTVVRTNGANAFTADQSMGGFKLTNVATPVSGTDAANKDYVDAASGAGSQIYKKAVRVVAVANTALTGGASLSIDSVSLANGDDVLLSAQTTASQNGIYTVSGIGSAYALTRRTDSDASSEVSPGMAIWVSEGTNYLKTLWILNTLGSITLDTTSLSFAKDTLKPKKQDFTLNGTDITNQYVDLSFLSIADSLSLFVDGVMQDEGSDFTLSTVSGVTRVTFAGDLATGGSAALVSGDILHIVYQY